jgi:hypothetical protein
MSIKVNMISLKTHIDGLEVMMMEWKHCFLDYIVLLFSTINNLF